MSILGQVKKGMGVYDSAGNRIGKVDHVRAPDAKAAAFEAAYAKARQSVLMDLLTSVGGVEPRVPAVMAERLLRDGYIRIDGHGLWARDSFAAMDDIERVDGQDVHLKLTGKQLPPKGEE